MLYHDMFFNTVTLYWVSVAIACTIKTLITGWPGSVLYIAQLAISYICNLSSFVTNGIHITSIAINLFYTLRRCKLHKGKGTIQNHM